ncbi:hypothetical protein TrST_g12083 [Triparma strigata]|uniref:Uncharacterized protein n=1 Tax=Triparma strigata TaxID=1606541 RepID=A0A9W7BSQ1_9STRA|nr:hypothetical protein TrST_g12083 [Triparma strigata]
MWLFISKLFFDFTGIVNCRQASFVGGAYSFFITLSTPFVCLLFGWMYLEHVKDDKASFAYVFSPEVVYGVIDGLGAIQLGKFFLFLRLIGPKYRNTFTSFRTAPQQAQEEFLTFMEPDLKLGIFDRHKSFWAPIAEEVRRWLNDSKNLERWIREKPEWFNDHVKANILDEFVDDPKLLNELRGVNVLAIMSRRRSLGGASVGPNVKVEGG